MNRLNDTHKIDRIAIRNYQVTWQQILDLKDKCFTCSGLGVHIKESKLRPFNKRPSTCGIVTSCDTLSLSAIPSFFEIIGDIYRPAEKYVRRDLPFHDFDDILYDIFTGAWNEVTINQMMQEYYDAKMSKLIDKRTEFDNEIAKVKIEAGKFGKEESIKVAAAKNLFSQLTDEERLDVMSDYCKCCGCNNPDCQCRNDD